MDRCLLMVVAMLPSETNTLSDSATLDLLVIYEFIIHSKKKIIDFSIFKKDSKKENVSNGAQGVIMSV